METCTLEREGFFAHYYEGTIEKNKAVIAVGGASCNEKTSIAMSQYLIKAGFNVLVLGFYLWKGLPKCLANIPIDYCEKAIHWLKEKKGIEKIAMTGASTGAGYTLVCASHFPEITCVMVPVPYDYVMEGTSSTNKRMHCSVYTYHGENIPYNSEEMLDKGMLWWFRQAKKAEGYGLARFMRWGYDQGEKNLSQEARIKTENMNADIILLAVKNDDCWPSDVAALRIVENLKKANYPHRVEYHLYEKGSHALTDGTAQMSPFTKLLMKLMIPAEKKYPKECDEARRDSLERILAFLKDW